MPDYTDISFRAIAPIDRELTSRTDESDSIHQTARRDLSRYYALLDGSLRDVNLSENEGMLIVDALNGTLLDETSYSMLWAEIEDACRLNRAGGKWQVHGPALVAKLKALSRGEAMAIVDAAERYWILSATETDSRRRLRLVGLIRE